MVPPAHALIAAALVAAGTPTVADQRGLPVLDLLNPDAPPADLLGARAALREAGFDLAALFVLDYSHNVAGGLDTQGDALRRFLSVSLTVDLPTVLQWPSGTLFLDFHHQAGQNGSDEVGDFQGVGNLDADGLDQVSEAWFEYTFDDAGVTVRAGKIEVNALYGDSQLNAVFVHGSAAFPVTDALMPTYPDPAFGVNVVVEPTDALLVQAGVFDGALQEGVRTGARGPSTLFGEPSDLYLTAEVGLRWSVGGTRPGLAKLGGWWHTGTFDAFDGSVRDGAGGLHVVVDQMLFVEAPPADDAGVFDTQGVGVFAAWDIADGDVLEAAQHATAGFTWRGALPSRDDDVLGVLASWVLFTDERGAGFVDDAELAVEVMDRAALTPWTAVQPYAQWVRHPGGQGLDDAVNLGVRLEAAF